METDNLRDRPSCGTKVVPICPPSPPVFCFNEAHGRLPPFYYKLLQKTAGEYVHSKYTYICACGLDLYM